jgi:hypothetical protein
VTYVAEMLRSAQLVRPSIILVPRRLLRRSTDGADDPSPSETVDDNLRPHVTFKLQASGTWGADDLRENNISLLSGTGPVPAYITRLQERLSQKRLVTESEAVSAPDFFLFFIFFVFLYFFVGEGGRNASCTVALLGAVCGTLVRLAIEPIYSLDNSAARPTH